MMGRVVAIVVVGLAVVVLVTTAVTICALPAAPDNETRTKAARAWVDSMGIRATGVRCDGWRCAVAPEHGAPFVLLCSTTCELEACQ